MLGVKELALKTSELLQKIPANEQGNMIGIFGKWGRGKSFFIRELWSELAKNSKNKKVEFHAWKYQDTPAIWAYLYERFSEEYFNDAKSNCQRIRKRFFLNYTRLGIVNPLIFISLVAISVGFSFLIPWEDKINLIRGIIASLGGIVIVIKLVYFYYKYSGTAKSLFKEYYNKVSFSKYLGTQAEVQKELVSLPKTWCTKQNGNKIYLFVEDIDRCSEQKVIDIVDSLRIMLEDETICKNVMIVAAIDERILQHAIKIKYLALFKKEDFGEMAELINEYFDKLFMLGLKLGDLSASERDEYFIHLTMQDRDELEVPQYESHLIRQKESTFGNASEKSKETKKEIEIDQKQPNDIKKNEGNERGGISNLSIEAGSIENSDKLKPEEIELLRKALRKHSPLTPRQIKIFYYRYLLVKIILEIEYSRTKQVNTWLYPKRCELMVDLILEYSKPGKRQQLSEHKNLILKEANTTVRAELTDGIILETENYCQLLRALDIIIAY